MAVKLHRCPNTWAKFGGHPCWKVQKALDEQGIEYEIVKGPWPGRKSADGDHRRNRTDRRIPRSSSRTEAGTASSRRTWRRRSATGKLMEKQGAGA